MPADYGTEVTKIRGTGLADRDQVVGAESSEPRHKHLLCDLTAQQRRHLAHQLQKHPLQLVQTSKASSLSLYVSLGTN